MKISEMKVGQLITAEFVLAGADLRKTKSNPPNDFLSLTLTDGKDTLDGKVWNYKVVEALPELNKKYIFYGTVGEYAGKKQLTIKSMVLSHDQDMTEFSCVYYKDTELLWEWLNQIINNIQNDKLRGVTKFIYDKYKKDILYSTSAKAVHHVGIGGNAFHTLDVCNIARAITEQTKLYDASVSLDLVLAGALLHDIGKCFTYTISGPVVDMSTEGLLFDHIVIGLQILATTAQNFDSSYNPIFSLLSHIVASHHGQLEYGSPVTPKFIEAYIVNIADGASANFDTLFSANIKAMNEGKEVTDRLYTLNNREHMLQTTVADMLLDRSNS